MASFNKVFLMGNLTRDPEMRQLPSGQSVCTLRLAVSRSYRTSAGETREDTLFIDVTAWGRQAETSNTYLRKGSSVFVEGSLRMEQWEDKNTGQQRQRHSVTAERVQFLNTAQRNGQQGGYAPQQGGYQQPAQQAAPYQAAAQPAAPAQYQAPAAQSAPVQQQAAPAPYQPPAAQPAPAQPAVQPPAAPSFDADDIDDDIPF